MADSERTPLLAVVQVRPRPPRYRNHVCRRCCTLGLSVMLFFATIAALVVFIAVPDCNRSRHGHQRHGLCIPNHPFHRDRNQQSTFELTQNDGMTYEELLQLLTATPDEAHCREWSKYYTSGPHLAGKNYSQAEWTLAKWKEFGIADTNIVAYDIYVNYPVGHSLKLLEGSKGKTNVYGNTTWKVSFEARLEEDVLEQDETTGLSDRIPTFHGYSASGNVTASYVYVNYGTFQDFENLQAANISLAGKIALGKYGKIFRGLKVKRAQELGMIGVILYSDPGDDGDVTDRNGNETYPDGPARESSSVQRGSVQFLSFAPGDPTTPGYPSKPGCPRQPANESTPSIPSIPISYMDALPLLKALNGHGPKASKLGRDWSDGGLRYKGVEYYIGPTPDTMQINLVNEQEYTITPMWNVIGIINGTIEDEVVIIGNHRDAWIAGGAGDPNSGSAALNEVVRSFGLALQKGWKPLRTIVFASWDGEEYGLLGSTEWVEEYLPWLTGTAVAYLNVDVGTKGPHFTAAAAPLLNKALIETAKLVLSPNQTKAGQTIYDVWDKHIKTMGSGSDFTAFQDFAGIPSADMGFTGGRKDAVYHYHSNYDSFHWMENFGDPGWHYHATIARMWALLTARIAETPVLQLNATDYSKSLGNYLDSVRDKLDESSEMSEDSETSNRFKTLEVALGYLQNVSVTLDGKAQELLDELKNHPLPWWRWWERIKLYRRVRHVNDAYKYLERQFLYPPGLDGRPWFKHVVFAPGLWTGYAGAVFPGLVESIDRNDTAGVFRWAAIITNLTRNAASSLEE